MDYNNGNNGINQGVPVNPGMPMQGNPMQGASMNQRMPMNQGAPMNQGMPMNQGAPMNQGMPMNQGAPMNQGRPVNPGMPMQGNPMQGASMNQRMPMNQSRPVNQGMPVNPGMPAQRNPMQGAPMNQRMPMQGIPMQGGPVNQRAPMHTAPIQGVPANPGIRSRNPLPPEEKRDTDDKEGSRLFSGDRKFHVKEHSISQGVVAGLTGFAGYIYGGILLICLVVALIVYGSSHSGSSGKKYSIPENMITYTGIFRNIYEKAASGTLGSTVANAGVLYDDDGTVVPAAPTAIGEDVSDAGYVPGGEAGAGSDSGTVTGATMELDNGGAAAGSSQAESYKELITQLESAIASGDTAFVGSKLSYEDEDGSLRGYPQSIVDHFVTYMSTNPDKRASLISELSNEKYSAQNDKAFVVKLPYIKFVVNMGYDNTTVSIPGFSDQVVNAGQSADIAPLLPCMYTLTISNPDWPDSVTRDIEANVNESTISINIKP